MTHDPAKLDAFIDAVAARYGFRTDFDFRGTIGVPGCIDADAPMSVTDLTLLKPEATRQDIIDLCRRARAAGAYSVCVNSSRVRLAAEELAGSPVLPICVVGFPLGAALPEAIATEAELAVKASAREIDMVLPVGLLKERDLLGVRRTIEAVVLAVNVPVKVILETCLLTDEEIVLGCLISREAGAAFVKTSTGFGSDGARVEHIRLMRRTVGNAIGVKASGKVRTFADARAMIEAGASRIGASKLEAENTSTGSY